MLFKKRAFTVYLILALLSIPLLIQAETPARQNLFKIERSKNANIIQYDAQVEPDGALSYLEKIFIQASGKGMSITVEYVELFGEDMKTGEARYQKFIP